MTHRTRKDCKGGTGEKKETEEDRAGEKRKITMHG